MLRRPSVGGIEVYVEHHHVIRGRGTSTGTPIECSLFRAHFAWKDSNIDPPSPVCCRPGSARGAIAVIRLATPAGQPVARHDDHVAAESERSYMISSFTVVELLIFLRPPVSSRHLRRVPIHHLLIMRKVSTVRFFTTYVLYSCRPWSTNNLEIDRSPSTI